MVNEVAGDVLNKSVYDTSTKTQKELAKLISKVLTDKTAQTTIDKVLIGGAGATAADSGVKDIIKPNDRSKSDLSVNPNESYSAPVDNTRTPSLTPMHISGAKSL